MQIVKQIPLIFLRVWKIYFLLTQKIFNDLTIYHFIIFVPFHNIMANCKTSRNRNQVIVFAICRRRIRCGRGKGFIF